MEIPRLWSIVIFVFFVALVGRTTANEGALGCGGFVGTAPSLSKQEKVDYSSIKLKLLNLDGVVKDSTECAPNGYYFLPLFEKEKREFIIKVEGQKGWSFDPVETRVFINDNNECVSNQHKGSDINFLLSGFSISGKVIGKDCGQVSTQGVGTSGVTIQLTSSSNSKVAQTTSNEQGIFTFPNVAPGKYKLKASHPDLTIEKNEFEISFDWGNFELSTPFMVSGYHISGTVLSTKEEPVEGVHFLLFSDQIQSINCESIPEKLSLSDKRKGLCHATSNKDGHFSFKNIPCGTYHLKPVYQGSEDKTAFDVQPPEVSLTVSDKGSVKLSQPFRVMGFSVHGRVVSSSGKGVPEVTIKLNGQEKTKTDSEGNYKLDQMTSSSYTIEAEKEHYSFLTLKFQKISPSVTTTLPDIFIKSLDLCGSLQVTQPPTGVTIARERLVALKNSNGDFIERKSTNTNGQFCFHVSPGTYQLSPELDSKERAAGLSFTSSSLSITVKETPVLNANFIQSRVIVSGRVKCIESPCDPSISISLISENSQTRITGLSAVGTEANYFIFKDVPSGSHKITISKNKDNWCWAKTSLDLEVKTEDVVNLEFVQTGYLVAAKLSHNMGLAFKSLAKNEVSNFNGSQGNNQFCLKAPGSYQVTPVSCYKFEKESFDYNTASSETLELTATHSQIHGIIEISQAKSIGEVQVNIKDQTQIKSVVAKEKGDNKLEYTHWAKLGDKLTITPTSSQFLFYPESRTIQINPQECAPHVDSFQARPGLFLSGKIEPAVADVTLKVYLKDGNEPILSVLSNDKGTFSAGPLYDDKEYRMSAEREGYNFSQQEKYNFKSFKLARIAVIAKDKEGNPISGVLLSLSGESYRSNNVTPSSGVFNFYNLVPGQYFLRPYLKEYSFQPTSYTIPVSSGEDVEIVLNSTRYAFSVFGKVTSLNGDAEKFITVEAIGEKGGDDHHEGESDVEGNFRIRGLLPNHKYQIRVKKTKENRIERFTPSQVSLDLPPHDTHNVSFIVFRKPTKFEVNGIVKPNKPEFLDSLKVTLTKKESNEVVGVQNLWPFSHFHFSGLSKGEYLLTLQSSLNPLVYAFQPQEKTIQLSEEALSSSSSSSSSSLSVELEFSANLHLESADSLTNGPFLTTLFFIGLFLVIFNFEKVNQFMQELRSGNFNRKPAPPQKDDQQKPVDDWLLPTLPKKRKDNKSTK